MKHVVCRANSLEGFIEKLPAGLAETDVVNLLIKNGEQLLGTNFFSIKLDDEELLRANRFNNRSDRDSFILRRKLLKSIQQKLALSVKDFYFSHSNKNSSLFYSFSSQCEVGADLEQPSSNIDFDGIAALFFSENEKSEFHIQKFCKEANFFRIWTQKEALAKCAKISLQDALKSELSSDGKQVVVARVTDRDYYIYSYRKMNDYISVATKKKLETMKTYEFK
jgi:phosphopantetheinyl transferase